MKKINNIIKKYFFNDAIKIEEGLIAQQFGVYGLSMPENTYDLLLTFAKQNYCPCCGDTLQILLNVPPEEDGFTFHDFSIYECKSCGFWRHAHKDSALPSNFAIPYVTSFSSQKNSSISYLSKEIESHPDYLYNLSPYKFEQFVSSVLSDFYKCEANYIGKSQDDGIDLILLLSDNPILVQIKRRQNSNATESVNVVKHMFASMYGFNKNVSKGMIVTTAKKYSSHALEWVNRQVIRDSRLSIDLIDITRLLEMIASVSKEVMQPSMSFYKGSGREIITERYGNSFKKYDDKYCGFTDINQNRYFYISIDKTAFYKVEDNERLITSTDDILNNSERITGCDFFECTNNLPEDFLLQVLGNWALEGGEKIIKPNY